MNLNDQTQALEYKLRELQKQYNRLKAELDLVNPRCWTFENQVKDYEQRLIEKDALLERAHNKVQELAQTVLTQTNQLKDMGETISRQAQAGLGELKQEVKKQKQSSWLRRLFGAK